MFRGSMVAIVTPFKDGKVDEQTLRELVRFHIREGTAGIVPCGTTGEAATLSYEEHKTVIDIVVQEAKGRLKVVAGTGSNNTKEAIELTKYAKKAEADGALLISPYYNKPTQNGIYLHYRTIAEQVDIPIIIYNIASRTGINVEPDTIAKLNSDCKNIVGVKEASGNLDQMSRIKLLCGDDFDLISGDDSLTLPILAIGGCGVISVVANIVPKLVQQMITHFQNGELELARKLHFRLLPLVKAMFIETNPIPVKTAMDILGLCTPELRLPLCNMSKAHLESLKNALSNFGLLSQT